MDSWFSLKKYKTQQHKIIGFYYREIMYQLCILCYV